MRIRYYLLFVFICFYSLLNTTTWHIKQDGTGNFTTIQEGINASADSDTILVYPGTYFENINYNGKNITVASLYLTTQNEQYINQTIIDGNQNGSCVRIMTGEDSTTVLCGFTLTNGSGSSYSTTNTLCGGGILIKDSQPTITNCIVSDNVAYSGGGLYCRFSDITLSKTKIINNHAYLSGGGISLVQGSNIIFDSEELCDIYLNYSAGACEIFKNWECPELEVFVDTFTVFDPDGYFIGSSSLSGPPPNDISMNIQNAKLNPMNADLYVSTNGNNSNSGLSVDEPLATINYALSLVKSDSLHPNTIHVASGFYSHTLNNQCFPLNMRGYVSLIGESMENTIFDAENLSPHIYDRYSKLDYSIKNLSFINGYGDGFVTSCMSLISPYQQGKYVIIENIQITDFSYYPTRLLEIFYVDIYIKNITSHSNHHILLRALNSYQSEQEVIIENAYIHNNSQYSPQSGSHSQMEFGQLGTNTMNVNIINMEMTENQYYSSPGSETCSGIEVMDNVNLNLINCTIGNNSSPNNGGVIRVGPGGQNSVINIYNSILYGDLPGEIYIDNEFSSNPSTVNIHNSLVDGGFECIENVYSWNVVNWMEGNLDEDPLWQMSGDYPYMLQSTSPCIDAGTLDLPAGIELPEYDLAGNPRIYGDVIDMGAYEWQGTPVSDEELVVRNWELSNYPNPFNPETTISFSVTQNSDFVNLEVYNIKGQKIKTLPVTLSGDEGSGNNYINTPSPSTMLRMTQAGSKQYSVIWNGTDANNKPVSSGIYFYRLETEGKTVTKKMLLLK